MSYTVKNCPALRGWVCNEQFIKQDKMIACQDCTDCVIKQVIEKANREMNYEESDMCEILELFEIEEINK